MTLAEIIAIMGAINTLLSIAKALPGVLDEVKSLLAKIDPHVDAFGAALRAEVDDIAGRVAVA